MTLRFRDFIGQRRGEMRSYTAILAQKGESRSSTSGLLAAAGLALSTTLTKFKTTRQALYQIGTAVLTKDPIDNLVFSAAHTITGGKHGAVLVQINAAGAITTKVVATPQAYATGALALAALPAADADHATLGYFAIAADRETDGLAAIGTLAISGVAATKFKTTTTADVRIAGVHTTKPPTDNLVFSAVHVVSTTKFGVILVQMNAAGVISTKAPLTPQAYADAPTALAALPAPDAGNVALGYITVHAGGTDFTANTTALTGISGFVDGTPNVAHDFVANTDDLNLVTHSIVEPLL